MECIDRSSRQQQSIVMPHRHINMKSRTPYRIPSAAGWCCTLILALTLSANAFNLENRLPLIKYGSAGSYFGYSVAEHVETDSEDIKWWVHFLAFIVRGGSDNVERFTLRDTSWNAWVRCRFVYLWLPYVIFAVKCRYLHCKNRNDITHTFALRRIDKAGRGLCECVFVTKYVRLSTRKCSAL